MMATMGLRCGRIELIIGPMFAGKTTELMRRVKRETHALRKCFVIKYSKDCRYDVATVVSHDQTMLKAQAAVNSLSEVKDIWQSFDVLAVDEGQFFPDLVSFCNTAADAGKMVVVSALDGDYRRQPFGHICDLIPHCESVKKLTAVCMVCHEREASFTRRTVDAQQQELIGGADMYIATCRECFSRTDLALHECAKVAAKTASVVESSFASRAKPAEEAALSQPVDGKKPAAIDSAESSPAGKVKPPIVQVEDEVPILCMTRSGLAWRCKRGVRCLSGGRRAHEQEARL